MTQPMSKRLVTEANLANAASAVRNILDNYYIHKAPIPTGTADTSMLQAAADALAVRASGSMSLGGTLVLQEGEYDLDATVFFNQQGLNVMGQGPSTIIRWSGASSQNMFDVRDASRVCFSDFTLLGSSTHPPAAGIYFNSPTLPTVGTNEYLAVRRVMIGRRYTTDGAGYAPMQYGIRLGGAVIGNNDTLCVEDTEVHDASVIGIYIQNEQNRWNTLKNVVFNGCATGLRVQGNTTALGLSFNRSSVVDIYVDNSTLDILGLNSEHAAKLWTQMPGASLSIHGGHCNLQAEIGSIWASSSVTALNHLVLDGLYVEDQFSANPKLTITGSSSNTDPAYVSIRGCSLPNGDSDTGYTITGFSAGTPLYVDIMQGAYWRHQLVQSTNAAGKFTSPASRQHIGTWYADAAAASQTNVALNLGGVTTGTFGQNKRVMIRAGSLTGVVVRSNVARTAGSLTVEVTKNGAGIGLIAILDDINTTAAVTTQEQLLDTFAATDQIGVRLTTTSDWTPGSADITVEVEITTT